MYFDGNTENICENWEKLGAFLLQGIFLKNLIKYRLYMISTSSFLIRYSFFVLIS